MFGPNLNVFGDGFGLQPEFSYVSVEFLPSGSRNREIVDSFAATLQGNLEDICRLPLQPHLSNVEGVELPSP